MKSLKQIAGEISALSRGLNCDKILAVTDRHVADLGGEFLANFPFICLPPGEENKNLAEVEKVWRFMEAEGATRRSLLVNFGGGMVTDMGGFAAATFKRGIRYANVATTLLGAVDAAVGGKTGVNFNGLKNEIGAFALPETTIPAASMFATLPEKEWLSGYGEMLKTGLLAGKELFDEIAAPALIEGRNPALVAGAVEKCADFKKEVVETDFRESGRRKILNLGHTAGHAFEMICLGKGCPVAHGIAVAYGIMVSLVLSRMLLDVDPALMYLYSDILKNNFPAIDIACSDIERAVEIMGHDKKNSKAGCPQFVLLKDIGKPITDIEPSEADILSALEISLDMFR